MRVLITLLLVFVVVCFGTVFGQANYWSHIQLSYLKLLDFDIRQRSMLVPLLDPFSFSITVQHYGEKVSLLGAG